MSRTLTDQTLAIAGILQATSLVQQVARKGQCDSALFEVCIKSLFVIGPKQAEEVFGGEPSNLRLGLEQIVEQLGGSGGKRDVELTRYLVALLHLERKLAKRPDLRNKIADGLDQVRRQLEHFPHTHANVVGAIADIYVNTISTLTPRIMVMGEHGHLNHPDNANRVRALLLAGVRAAALWTQSGGNRFRLIFSRRSFLEEALRLLRIQSEQ